MSRAAPASEHQGAPPPRVSPAASTLASQGLEPGWYRPKSFTELCELAHIIARSNLCPADFRGNPNDVMVALLMGAELGLSPMQALQNIAILNGRPALWGDAVLAVCKQSPPYEYCRESLEGILEDGSLVAICRVKRRGEPEAVRTFSWRDAKKAQLIGKLPWQTYPKRMLQMRARSFALRDVFPDVLRGMWVAEEARDIDTSFGDAAPRPAPAVPTLLPSPPRRDPQHLQEVLTAIRQASDVDSLVRAVAQVHTLHHEDKVQVRQAYRLQEKHLSDGSPTQAVRAQVREKLRADRP